MHHLARRYNSAFGTKQFLGAQRISGTSPYLQYEGLVADPVSEENLILEEQVPGHSRLVVAVSPQSVELSPLIVMIDPDHHLTILFMHHGTYSGHLLLHKMYKTN